MDQPASAAPEPGDSRYMMAGHFNRKLIRTVMCGGTRITSVRAGVPTAAAHTGALHVLGCDNERCGVCDGQFTDCECINKCSIHRKPWTLGRHVIVDSVKEKYNQER